MEMTAHKAVAALISALVVLIGMFGVSTGWATPTLVDAVSAVLGALIVAFTTYMVPNKPKV